MNVNINRNTNINRNIDRSRYQNKITAGQGGQGKWKHNPEHRKGVSYRDQKTAQKFDRGASRDVKSRESFRGRAEAGRKDIARGGADQFRDRSAGSRQVSAASREKGSLNRGKAQQKKAPSSINRGSKQQSKVQKRFWRL